MTNSITEGLPPDLCPLAIMLNRRGAIDLLHRRLAPRSEKSAKDWDRYLSLKRSIVEACDGAITYRDLYRSKAGTRDCYDVGRQRETAFFATLSSHIRAGRKFTSFVRQYGHHIPLSQSYLLKKGVKLSGLPGKNRRELPLIVLQAYLDALARCDNDRKDRTFGPDHHRYQVGPLYFANMIDNAAASQIRLPSTALVFQLTSYLRLYTGGGDVSAEQCLGEPMPQIGKPCWPISAAFLLGSLEIDQPPEVIARGMNKLATAHPEMHFMGWNDEAHWQDD